MTAGSPGHIVCSLRFSDRPISLKPQPNVQRDLYEFVLLHTSAQQSILVALVLVSAHTDHCSIFPETQAHRQNGLMRILFSMKDSFFSTIRRANSTLTEASTPLSCCVQIELLSLNFLLKGKGTNLQAG